MNKLPGKNGTISHGYDKNGEFLSENSWDYPIDFIEASFRKNMEMIDQ